MPNLRPLRVLLLRLGAVAVIFSLQRACFVLLNLGDFPSPPLSAFVGGIRFDLSAIGWIYIPWTLAFLIAPRPVGFFAKLQKGLFHLSNIVCFLLNCVDLEYFKFTLKRSTADLFGIATGGSDMGRLLPVFLKDYWYVVLIFLCSIALAELAYRRAARVGGDAPARPRWLWRAITVAIVALMARGGVQYIPLTAINASLYAPPAYMPVVLNTPFTFMTSLGKPLLDEKHFMPQAEADRVWPVMHQYNDSALIGKRPNVVVLILESFSADYSAKLNGTGKGYMPFLDSLMGQSLWFTHAYANGRRSIDGIPAVVASMPKMMPEAFIESPYAQEPITALPGLLDREGYSTSFFHGGHNGTMGFDSFAKSAGFQRYVGRDQYPDPRDDDGVWGIRDRPFLQFFAHQLNKEKQPFMSCLFTLSSHHPYKLLPEDTKRFAGGDLPILPTLRYSDDAIRQFFATAEKMPWFSNTLFVLTADHTADLKRDGQATGSAFDHWVPMIFYMPTKIAPRRDDQVVQQIDILPTVMDMIGYHKPFFAYGSSFLRNEGAPSCVSQNSATWLIIGRGAQLRSDGENVLWSAPMRDGSAPGPALQDSLMHQLQAAVQQYNHHLLLRDMGLKGK